MKKFLLPSLVAAMSLLSLQAFSQNKEKVDTTNKLGLAGDGLDLYAVLDVFQNSKTIEAFEKSLNDKENKLNNLDLDLDKKVDFIKVVTDKKDKKNESYLFILRVDVSKTESQDVAVISLDRDKDKKVNLQIIGDEELYGKDYVIEPKGNSSITPNPGYKGEDPVTVTVEAPATNVVVQQAPIVQYVYSPAYVPYYPPYYYGYYPGWFAFSAVMTWGMYAGFHNHYHGGYYGGHYGGGNNNIIINNGDKINHYKNNDRRGSDRVSDNRNRGNYGNGRLDHGRGGGLGSTRPSTGAGSNRPSAGTRPSTGAGGSRPSAGTRPSTGAGSSRPSTSTRPSTSNRSSSSFNTPSTSNRSSSYGGGGRSGGFSGGGGGYRGGGGGGRRR